MNVYDFDGTIYKGDSTVDFYLYLIKHRIGVIKYLPKFFVSAIKYKLNIIDKTKMKEVFYYHLNVFKNGEIDELVSDFWSINKIKIYDWYMKVKQDDDVIISASPRYILGTICEELGIKTLICSEVDKKTGIYDGLNCHGEEKVNRFYKSFPNAFIDRFYSDSKSDEPLARIAKEAYIVRHGKIRQWSF